MRIEKITITDIPALIDLINSVYRGKGGWTAESHLLEGARVNEQMLLAYLDNKAVTILKLTDDTNKITGTVYLELKGEKLYLGMLSVSPDAQNRQVGRILLEEAERFAKQHNCAVITITVISVRVELIEWYERRGFIRTGHVEPFPENVYIGIPKEPLELIELEKGVKIN
jgi:ribosomal protein S18 acetylase RimI-like enzyme